MEPKTCPQSAQRPKSCHKPGRTKRIRARLRKSPSRPAPAISPPVIAFLRWLKSSLSTQSHSHLQVVNYPNLGLGLRLIKKSLSADQLLLSIPPCAQLLPSVISASEPEIYQNLDSPSILMLWLLIQRQTQASSLSPYLNILPKNLQIPGFLPSIYNPLLSHPVVPESFKTQLRNTTEEFNDAKLSLLAHLQRVQLEHYWDEDLFTWAYQIVNTRAFDPNPKIERETSQNGPKDTHVLVPLADLCNHSQFARLYVETDDSGIFTIRTRNPIRKYEQIFYNYRPCESNRTLYLDYGFVDILQVPETLSAKNCGFTVIPSRHDAISVSMARILEMLQGNDQFTNPESSFYQQLARLRQSNIFDEPKTIFKISWPSRMTTKDELRAVSFDSNLNIDLLNYRTLKHIELPEMSQNGHSIDPFLDILLVYLSSASLQPSCRQTLEMYQKVTQNDASSEGFLSDCLTIEERKIYAQLQVDLIDYLLRYEYGIAWDLKETDQRAKLAKYWSKMEDLDDSVRRILENEIALLLFTRWKCRLR